MQSQPIAAVTLATLAALTCAPAAPAQCERAWLPGHNSRWIIGETGALTVFNDGSGPALYIAGVFNLAGDVPPAPVIRFRNGALEPVGDPPPFLGTTFPRVFAAYDDGHGPALYVCGDGQGLSASVFVLAKWDGVSWSAVPAQFFPPPGLPNPVVTSMAAATIAGVPSLVIGGAFRAGRSDGPRNVAIWNGAALTGLHGGLPVTEVTSLTAFPTPSGQTIIATAQAGVGVNMLWGEDGLAWSAIPGFVSAHNGESISSLVPYSDAAGSGAYAILTRLQPTRNDLLRAGAGGWVIVGPTPLAGSPVLRLVNDGPTPALYCTGVEGQNTGRAARFADPGWLMLPPLPSATINALAAFPDGPEGSIFAGTSNSYGLTLAAFAGQGWAAVESPGDGANGAVNAIARFDPPLHPDAAGLYIAGSFTLLGDGAHASITRFDGATFHDVAGGINGSSVACLLVHDPGSGPALYAAGNFDHAGGIAALNIARFDGAAWSALPTGPVPTPHISALCSFASPSGPRLIATGEDWNFPGLPYQSIAQWDGAAWLSMGQGLIGTIAALAMHDDDGPGPLPPALYAGGSFLIGADLVHPRHLARWDGASWVALPEMTASVSALASFDDGSGGGAALFVSGGFLSIDSIPHRRAARYRGGRWLPANPGFWGAATALTALQTADGPRLFAIGGPLALDGFPAGNAAMWNGQRWVNAAPSPGGLNLAAKAVAVFTEPADGAERLLFAGPFTRAGALVSDSIAVTALCPVCAADVNRDGAVDFIDLNALLSDYGSATTPQATPLPTDVNADGVVDFIDLNALLSAYGMGC